jgi:hypothetical protein
MMILQSADGQSVYLIEAERSFGEFKVVLFQLYPPKHRPQTHTLQVFRGKVCDDIEFAWTGATGHYQHRARGNKYNLSIALPWKDHLSFKNAGFSVQIKELNEFEDLAKTSHFDKGAACTKLDTTGCTV